MASERDKNGSGGGVGGTSGGGAGNGAAGLDPVRLDARKRLLKPAMRWMRDMYVAAATLIKTATTDGEGGTPGAAASPSDGAGAGAGGAAATGDNGGAGDSGDAGEQPSQSAPDNSAGAGAGAGAGADAGADAGAGAGAGAGAASAAASREAVLEAAAAEFLRSDQCSLPRLRTAFFHIPEPVDETDTDLTLAALAPIISLLEKAPAVRGRCAVCGWVWLSELS